MATPTQAAEDFFRRSQNAFTRGIVATKSTDMADVYAGLTNMAEGLVNLAVGVRATYILLEEVKRKLDSPARR